MPDEALRIHHQMALPSFHFFACIIATGSSQSYGFDALAVDDRCARLGLTSHLQAHPFPQHRMDLFPQAISSEEDENNGTLFSREEGRGEASAKSILIASR